MRYGRERSKSLRRFVIGFVSIFFVAVLASGIFIKCKYFSHKLPTKSIKMEDIRSVQIINLDRAKERRANYEKMLHDNFGDTFMGRKIGEEIRLSGVDGKKEIIFENLDNGKKYKYEQIKGREDLYLRDRQFKIYSEKDKNNYWYFSFTRNQKEDWRYDSMFNIFGCNLSHWKAIENISKQPDGTYGIIFEDDFYVGKDFDEKLQNVLREVPEDFDVIKISLTQSQFAYGYRRLPLSKKHIGFIKKSFHKYGYGSWMDLSIPQKNFGSLSVGCQGYIVSAEGARKIIEHTRNHIVKHTGNDNNLNFFFPKDKIIKSYIYLKEVPVLLSDDAVRSQLVLNDKNYNSQDIK